MGRILTVAAVIAVLTASGVCAGNFDVLADAGVVKPSAAFHIKPGTVVKAEFSTRLKTASDVEMGPDNLLPEPVAATDTSRIKARPAIALRERRGMAPPPKLTNKAEQTTVAAEENIDLENDLEKDLVLSPPPQKSEDQADTEKTPVTEKKSATEKTPAAQKKVEKKKTAPSVKQIAPSDFNSYAQSTKPIRKVKPVTQNPWSNPAGNYVNRQCPVDSVCRMPESAVPVRPRVSTPGHRPMDAFQAYHPEYATSEPRRTASQSPHPDRFVRDGVTIKLAPAAAPATYPADAEEESSGSDILSSAAEIIGLPFAFISSFF
ncbi:MAG TPA: hypothetical protein VK463_21425 [Desulfomonilaceae bacterium]|nr:hypothetical protein [Desulfomonilaceae bacterium]